MAARDFDDVEAMTQDWRAEMDTARPPRVWIAPPDLRAFYHLGRALDAGRITDGLGEQIADEIETYLRKGSA